DVPLIPGSEEEMHEVLTNLIFNAVDAMPEGGNISISTEDHDNEVTLIFSDAGKGMREDVRKQCFEPFFSTNKLDGSGLGLVVVNNVVERHNGRIECSSEENKGTTFKIYLPKAETTNYYQENNRSIPNARNLNILVVDDEELIRKLVLQFLEIEGHTVETATNGKEAHARISEKKFDLLITDWAMPELNGADLINTLRQEKVELPIVLMTGFDSDPSHDVTGIDLNADALLGKPITQESLQEAINHALNKTSEINWEHQETETSS
ncbi:MAG: hybrid sensor histidine kinase/response regulator, partial [Verrucomicrobiota bacterium]